MRKQHFSAADRRSAALSFSERCTEPVDDPVEDAGDRSVDDDRPGDREHFRRHARHKALCLCQDRDEGNFCPILLGFWLLKFLKKSAFFAKLL